MTGGSRSWSARACISPNCRAVATALAVAFALVGCAHDVVPPEAAPKMDIPENWAMAAASPDQRAADERWWRQFGSPEMSGLVEEGKRTNLQIAAAVSRVQQAQIQAQIAGVSLLPAVGLSVGAAKTLALGSGAANTSANGIISASYEIDFWGKNRAGKQAAEANFQANVFDRATVSLTVSSSIVSTYLQIMSLHDRRKIAEQNAATAERVLRLVNIQENAGAASPLDLARQRSALAGLRAVIPDLIQQEREAQSALAILLGKSPQTFSVSADGLQKIKIPVVTPGLPSELLDRRPDIRRAEYQLAAANANVAVARASMFPSISLTGSTGGQSNALLSLFNGPSLFASLGSSLVAPIFDGGYLRDQRDLAQAKKEELIDVYRSTVLTALSEVDVALGQISSMDERLRLKQTELEQAQYAFDLSETRYRVGAEDLMTVLDTQRSLSDVQSQLGQMRLQRLQATVSLYKALGGGWQSAADDVASAAGQAAPAGSALRFRDVSNTSPATGQANATAGGAAAP